MTKFFLQSIMPIVIAVCILVLIIVCYQSNYNKIIFECQISVEHLSSSDFKSFLNETGSRECKCFVTRAHPHRPFYLLYLMVKVNSHNVIQNLKHRLVKSPRPDMNNLTVLQNLGAVNKEDAWEEYILVGDEQPLYIYVSEQVLIICFPAQNAQSVNKVIGGVFGEG